jgi:hypothetical protein
MTDSTHLERRYRRLLALYPKEFRHEHAQEMLSVLIAGAVDGQRRPRLAEAADLVANAIFMRLRQTRLPGSWERRHARVMAPVRVAIGIWLLVLTSILYGYGRGGWWGALLLPSAALHFFLAYRLRHTLRPAGETARRSRRR